MVSQFTPRAALHMMSGHLQEDVFGIVSVNNRTQSDSKYKNKVKYSTLGKISETHKNDQRQTRVNIN